LITRDKEEGAMEGYAKQMNMPWPQLKLSEVAKFREEFSNHPKKGIPSLVLTDIKGEILKTSFEGEQYIGPQVVTEHLKNLLKVKPAKK
jgi:hypothetical protein